MQVTNQGPHSNSKYGTLGLEPRTLLALTPHSLTESWHSVISDLGQPRRLKSLGNSDGGTGAPAQRRAGFYLIAYMQLFPCNGLEVAHKATRQDQVGGGEEDGVRTGTQIQTGPSRSSSEDREWPGEPCSSLPHPARSVRTSPLPLPATCGK